MRLFQLLGVDTEPEPLDAAVLKWPGDRVQVGVGEVVNDDGFPELLTHLEAALQFRAVRPGAEQPGLDPEQLVKVGLAAEVHVEIADGPVIALSQLEKIGFQLQLTRDVPAHLFVTRGPGGVEVVIHGLPVAILFPPGMIMPRRTREELDAGDLPDVRVAPPPGPGPGFDANHPDSLEIKLSDHESSKVLVRVDVRLTELGDFYFATAAPISIGACRFAGLPVKGLHDLQLIPTVAPDGVPRSHLDAELPLEWKRHPLDWMPANAITSYLAIRTVDLDMDEKPWTLLARKLAAGRTQAEQLELVVEDLVMPFFEVGIMPIPVHGRVGMRRRVLVGTDGGERYNLALAPAFLVIGPMIVKLFRFLIQTTDLDGEAPVALDAVIHRDDDVAWSVPEAAWSFPLSFTEDWRLTFGVTLPVGFRPHIANVFGRQVWLAGAELGLSFTEIRKLIEGDGSAADAFRFTIDLELSRPATGDPGSVELVDKVPAPVTAPRSMYLRGVGWDYGKPAFGALYDPSEADLQLFKKVRLRIEEIGLVTEDNGGFYVSVSASLEKAFGSTDTKPADPPAPGAPPAPDAHGPCARTSAGRSEAMRRGLGVHLHRFRTRIAGDDTAPRFLLDGASVFLSIGKAELSGFLALREYDLPPGNHYSELAGGLQVCFKALGKQLDLGIQMVRGRVTGVDDFTYWMFALVLGGLPLGSAELTALRVLVVENLAPNLPPADGTQQPMRLYRWYQANLGAVELPQHRALTAWAPRDQSCAFGAAATVSFAGTKAIRLHGFFFMMRSPEDTGLLAGLEVYALKAQQPIAFGAFEWDDTNDKWGLTIGFNVGLESLFGSAAGVLAEFTIAGLLFFGNRPDTIAIGQYNDTSTWPSLRFQFNRWWKLDVFVGGCYHRVDAASALDPTTESVDVFGAIVSAKGTVKFGIGTIKLYFTLSWISGQWRNEAMATGHVLIIEAGVRIRLFGCFNFGASVKVDHAVLGPGPSSYSRTSTILRIETPWWLPDVTVRWEVTDGTPAPAAMPVVSRPLVAASAIEPGPRVARPIGAAGVDPAQPPVVRSLAEVRALTAPAVSAADWEAQALISCDSELALDFKPALDASATVVPGTPPSAGRQRSNQLSVTYELVAIGIRRRVRHGPGGEPGPWTDLLDPLRTELDALDGVPPSEWQTAFQSAVGFDWDADVVRLNRLEPRRLLVNAVTPYSFLGGNPEGDEILAATSPGWPCCKPSRPKRRWHTVDFEDTAVGARTPTSERFTESASTLRWVGGRPPVVVEPAVAPPGARVARIDVDGRAAGPIATAAFAEPAAVCEVHAYWRPAHSHARFVVDAYRGLDLISSHSFDLAGPVPSGPIRIAEARGITALALRKHGEPGAVAFAAASSSQGRGEVELVLVRYRSLAEERRDAFDDERCRAQDDRFHGGGRLAWLPNRDYEVTIRTRAVLGHTPTAVQDATIEQRAFFRTRGLPGLNAVARVGEELEPYVESVYPAPGTTLYRTEPIALAFNERWNVLAPIDRAPTAADPEERHRMMRWVLATEEVGADGVARVSQTSRDWIVDHRPPSPPLPRRPAILDAVMTAPIRRANSLEPLRVRLDRMLTRPGGCGGADATLHTSQVLVHAPYDPERPDAAAARWPARRSYRVNLRLEGAPFVERAPFEAADLGAFSADAGWLFDADAIRAPRNGLALARFGDALWDHVQVIAGVDPEGHAAGLATADGGLVALIDERDGQLTLRIQRRLGTAVVDERTAALAPAPPRPFVLEVAAFDDELRARVGTVEVGLPRRQHREGRLALIGEGGGRFTRLAVRGLDGYRFQVATSRYDSFVDHVASFAGLGVVRPGDLGAPTATAAELFTTTSAELTAAMAPGADLGARDRLFAHWGAALALPVRAAPERLELTRHEVGAHTGVILLESPEPLPLDGDVTLTVRKRRLVRPPFPRPFPVPPVVGHRRGPRLAEDWLAELDFESERAVVPALPPWLARARRLVEAVARPGGGTALRTFALATRGDATTITLVDVVPDAAARFRIAPGEVALLDDVGDLVLTPVLIPPPAASWANLAVRILTSADAHRALIIPVAGAPATHAPLTAGTYRFDFTLDRTRWRAAAPDATSSYRAVHTLAIGW